MKKLFFIIFLIFILQTNIAFALEINYPPVPGADPPQNFLNSSPELLLANYAKYLVYLCMWTAGIIALLALVSGGVRYILATGNPDKLSNAKEQILSAFLGLLILLSATTILNIINPDFTSLKIESLSPEKLPDKGIVNLSAVKFLQSTIDPEVSPGRIIEKMFETYISEYPAPAEEDEWTPRVLRLRNRALAADEIVEKTYDIVKELYTATTKCGCEDTRVEPGKECYVDNCMRFAPYECTCDPCKDSRSTIIKKEEELHNIVYIGQGITITDQMNKNWEIETIENTSLMDEIIRQEEELRLFKEQFNRLERARKYIKDCPLRALYSYVQVLDNKKALESGEAGALRIIDFWNDVNIIYNRPKKIEPRYFPIPYEKDKMEYVYDFATFYCDISGTIAQALGPGIKTSAETPDLTGDESEDEAEQILAETTACSKEAPFGDYLDRVERVAKLLIKKFETIISKEKEIIDSIDRIQEGASQCSSRRTPIDCVHICVEGTEAGVPICYDDKCKNGGDPCPDYIKTEYQKITDNKNDIDLLVHGKKPRHDGRRGDYDFKGNPIEAIDYTDPNNVGIIMLLEKHVPKLLQELEEIIRYPMKECYFENLEKKGTALFNCSQSQGASNPHGEIIYYCCQTEDENGEITSAGLCYEKCFLKDNWKAHRDCVYACLIESGGNELPLCMHELNFYCCNVGED